MSVTAGRGQFKVTRNFLNALLITLLVVGTACGSGGGSAPVVGGGLGGAFAPDQPNPGAATVSAAEGGVGGNLVTVQVAVTDTSNVYGASFSMTYNPNIASFMEWSNGSLLDCRSV